MDLARRIAPIITLSATAAAGLIGAIAADHLGASLAFTVLLIGNLVHLIAALHPPVRLRDDLAVWVARTSAVTGESADDLVNRAVARLRAGFSPAEDPLPDPQR
ncbi:MAG: hypothetical protein ACE367_07270 [Acidimicrobiales bacterium]